jgi:hypothetical protein
MEDRPDPARYVQVAVPEDLVEAVYAFITEHRRLVRTLVAEAPPTEPADEDEARDPADDDGAGAVEEESAWDEQSLRGFLDIANPKLTALLVYLAERAPDAVPADEAVAAAGLIPGRSVGGFLSRARASSTTRFGYELPIEKDWNYERGRSIYWVTEDNARIILDVAKAGLD